MKLRMVSIDHDGSVRLAADGPITSSSLGCINPFEQLLGGGWSKHRLLLDLSQVETVDSSAIGWLINCHKALDADGGTLVLHSVRPKVLRILMTLKIEAILPLTENESAARAVLTGNPQ